ncbi:PIN domain-containing protein [Hymenobacter sp. RP-2-7]|uniref:PIN domain-containing protein n=1 Tax=Hymenobacter polaris TaxID=2682546 RepID=A0A7Y0FLR3_9BACT|nr:PIN domain-containing protein [Hymenobacter polaris]NML64696.1 PIN domain-containing protein [Hymenobacter polaris]
MRRFYLDSNIVLDFALNRVPFAQAAESLLAAGQNGQLELLVSGLTFVTVHYILSKAIGKEPALQALADLAAQVTIATVDSTIVSQALQAGYPDFEDAVQLFAAIAAGAEAIVTRDPKGFQASPVAVMDPLTALVSLN